ncbi:RNA-binding S4 domain-containing protein [Uliginosibacterium sp. 31-16]|uniref:RNA-binding S4 domain-containing protein n=1 Tax=Uliginosibacterium sp. 31-16 TaxID=3068315 RepID=UPI0027400285|nr:RNA-binding S4 domain-containing protein [Uliginosibacterium sp. 31-16]MDP5238651.1 RNA-binding S4 domain-containing protein [Uliginosibacterium sp. 31-16]
MNLHDFELTREFITLDSLLKLLTIAPSGGIAKMMVAAGEVEVNGEIELRKTRKIRAGDVVRVQDEEIRVSAAP